MSNVNKIFVSHSQYDKDTRRSFNEIFGLAGVKSVCMEFEKMQSPEWHDIKNELSSSEAVFLLLGENVNRSIYTQNWIAFEVGLACAYNKRIWVFEKEGSNVLFPIPYLTDYVTYNLEKATHFDYIRTIIKDYGQPDTILIKRTLPKGKQVECPRCSAKYTTHIDAANSHCPSCRQVIGQTQGSSSTFII